MATFHSSSIGDGLGGNINHHPSFAPPSTNSHTEQAKFILVENKSCLNSIISKINRLVMISFPLFSFSKVFNNFSVFCGINIIRSVCRVILLVQAVKEKQLKSIAYQTLQSSAAILALGLCFVNPMLG